MSTESIKNHTFAQRLRLEREAKKWTQQRLADDLGVSKGSLVGWESGRFAPNADVLVAMAAAGMDVQFLITGIALQPEYRDLYRRAAVHTLEVANPNLARVYLESFPAMQAASGPSPVLLSPQESELVSNYRSASAEGKNALQQTSSALAKRGRSE